MRPARLFLVGFPASGKSTLARRWGRKLGVLWLDLDEWITKQTGQSPEVWLERSGEAAFREVEKQAFFELVQAHRGPVIVALGGGTLTVPLIRAQLAAQGWRLWIDPPWPWLRHRLEKSPRPLLRPKPISSWEALWLARRPFYREADLHWNPACLPEAFVLRWVRRILLGS